VSAPSQADALTALHGRYRGLGWHRSIWGVMVVPAVAILFSGNAMHRPATQWLLAILVIGLLMVPFDLAYGRRMGFSITDDGLTLHTAGRRRYIAWEAIDGFEWAWLRQSELLWVVGPNLRVAIPTVARASLFPDSWFRAGKLRGPGGVQLDSWDTVQAALRAARTRNP
jgi:hypothetical protein